jgi:hypothetical protein
LYTGIGCLRCCCRESIKAVRRDAPAFADPHGDDLTGPAHVEDHAGRDAQFGGDLVGAEEGHVDSSASRTRLRRTAAVRLSQSSRSSVISRVVNRWPHASHFRRRRVSSWCGRESMTDVDSQRQQGQIMQAPTALGTPTAWTGRAAK